MCARVCNHSFIKLIELVIHVSEEEKYPTCLFSSFSLHYLYVMACFFFSIRDISKSHRVYSILSLWRLNEAFLFYFEKAHNRRKANMELFISFLSTFSFIEFILSHLLQLSMFSWNKLNKIEKLQDFYLTDRHERKAVASGKTQRSFFSGQNMRLCNFSALFSSHAL